MLKKTSLCALALMLCVCVLCSCGAPAVQKDFRDVNWGDKQAAVEKAEPTECVFADDEIMEFIDKTYDIDSEIIYLFDENGLHEAQNKFLVNAWILEDTINSYHDVAKKLTERYGEPVSGDYHIWHTDSELYEEHKGDTEIYAVYYKILEFKYEWQTERENVTLTLNYKDEQINYVLNATAVPQPAAAE